MPSVLIVDDSPTARDVLAAILSSDPMIEVAGFAENGQQAVELAKTLAPDVITMDINMPVLNGLQATKEIMIECPTPIVIVSSIAEVQEVEWSMQALRAGALTALKKPTGPSTPEFAELAEEIIHTVKAMAGVYVIRHRREPSPRQPVTSKRPAPTSAPLIAAPPTTLRAVAIAASTGGPPALSKVLGALPKSFPAPILVVQHIVPSFVAGFVSWLDSAITLTVEQAVDGQRVEPGTVYVAPPECHLGLSSPSRIEISDAAPIFGFRPAATYLFQSVAQQLGKHAAGVMLTGMGTDGVAGLVQLHRAGGFVVAQDEASCVIFGMPHAAIEAGVVDAVLPLDQIACQLSKLAACSD